jgi:putative ABC transport system substrate-binding protein
MPGRHASRAPIGADPVRIGLVTSLNRPGGNVTGVSSFNAELGTKLLGLLHELLPTAARFAVLVNPKTETAEPLIKDTQAAAAAIGRQIEVVTVATHRDIPTAFADLVQRRTDGLLVHTDVLFSSRRVQIATLAARHAVPAIYPFREYTEVGGLMSYGTNRADNHRQAGVFTGRILKGEKPAHLPVQQPTRFEFVINLQTAKALGIDIPATLLARANEVIE